ncbi:hypothetical protein [Corynebacterium halotolerans]
MTDPKKQTEAENPDPEGPETEEELVEEWEDESFPASDAPQNY